MIDDQESSCTLTYTSLFQIGDLKQKLNVCDLEISYSCFHLSMIKNKFQEHIIIYELEKTHLTGLLMIIKFITLKSPLLNLHS